MPFCLAFLLPAKATAISSYSLVAVIISSLRVFKGLQLLVIDVRSKISFPLLASLLSLHTSIQGSLFHCLFRFLIAFAIHAAAY